MSDSSHYSGEGHLIEAEIFGDPNKTVVPVVCDSDGKLLVDLTASTITIGDVVITDGFGNNAKVDAEGDLQVDVNNFPVTQTVNGTVTATQSTGTNLHAVIDNFPAIVTTAPAAFTADLFGRQRVATPFSLFCAQFRFDKNPLLWDELLAVSGTSTFDLNHSAINMAVTTASGSRVVRQTKEYFAYQPDRVHQLTATLVFGVSQTNTNQYVGIGDDSDGLFWTMQGTVLNVAIRTSTSGSPVTSFVSSSSFNIDKLNGSGPSGMTFDVTKTQLFVIEYQWFGVGTVRFGVYYNGSIYYCHEIHHANIGTMVYMKTGVLPIRYEIVNVGAAASASTMVQICSNVDSEAGYAPSGIKRSITSGTSPVTVGTTLLPLLSLRLKSTAIRGTIIPVSLDLIGTQADAYEYQLLLNPTLTGASFTSVDAVSIAEYDVSASVVTGGTAITSGFASSAGRVVIDTKIDTLLKLVSNIAGTSDIFTIAARHIGTGTVPMLVAMEWRSYI